MLLRGSARGSLRFFSEFPIVFRVSSEAIQTQTIVSRLLTIVFRVSPQAIQTLVARLSRSIQKASTNASKSLFICFDESFTIIDHFIRARPTKDW